MVVQRRYAELLKWTIFRLVVKQKVVVQLNYKMKPLHRHRNTLNKNKSWRTSPEDADISLRWLNNWRASSLSVFRPPLRRTFGYLAVVRVAAISAAALASWAEHSTKQAAVRRVTVTRLACPFAMVLARYCQGVFRHCDSATWARWLFDYRNAIWEKCCRYSVITQPRRSSAIDAVCSSVVLSVSRITHERVTYRCRPNVVGMDNYEVQT